ncbi:MAG: lamin tail domain-containing protein, partial [Planctomycetes bacterium]|nr:lamin tail domain-containing protein [Planctomycetota bacterium]
MTSRKAAGRLWSPGLVVCGLLLTAVAAGGEFDIAINEIHYNPFSDQGVDEFLELVNRGPTRVDIGGWALVEGIHFLFPDGLAIEPREFLVVSPDPAHTSATYGTTAVAGPYSGRLDNSGEIVTLVNRQGDVISRVHYSTSSPWPAAADGAGPSLELVDPHAVPDIPESWAASLTLDGTPGAENSRRRTTSQAQSVVFIEVGEVWRYRKGTDPYPAGWRDAGFDDSSWLSGPTGIGYADGDDATVLADMENGYASFAARRTFTVEQAVVDSLAGLTLEVDYDDAFVAYLNGVEAARSPSMGGSVGTPPAHDWLCEGSREAGTFETIALSPALLQDGENVLAVQVHNHDLGSSDASFIPRLSGLPGSTDPAAGKGFPVVINEIKGTETTGGFIELYNRGAEAQSLRGVSIGDSVGHRFAIGGGTTLGGGGFLVFTDAQIGFDIHLAGVRYALLADDGRTLLDSFNPQDATTGETDLSFGRYPDGDDDGFLMRTATAGAPNELELPTDVIVSEIYFHPPYVEPHGDCARKCSDLEQWIELHNRGAEEADISGWSLTKAIDFTIPAGTTIPAGGHLVLCSSRETFLASHPGFDASLAVGDWSRNLAHDSETINLRDELENLVDHVRYADGTPLNDEEPMDGIDDRTFLGSDWPSEAQASGRTIELVHPELDNRYGPSWTAGPVGGTPGAQNASHDASPPPVIAVVQNAPALPRSSESVAVTCQVRAVGTIAEVRLLWHRDGGGGSGTAVMRDDGLSGDEAAGDGRYTGIIPAQADRSVIAFQIDARLETGQTTLVPRAPAV